MISGKKICTAALCIMILPVLLTGCKKDENNHSDEPLIGVVSSDASETVPVPEESGQFREGEDVSAEEGIPETAENIPGTDSASGTIVWLGDSLTQGSLGDIDDNLPNAPYIKLAQLSGRNVEGYGYYGYNTHDIFWVYVDEAHENQKKDPNKTYVFWVGSNDWVVDGATNDDAGKVISEIDSFVSGGGITKYIVLGTTARYELRSDYRGYNGAENANIGKDMYSLINQQLSGHYGEKYLDVNTVISTEGGYGPDNIHLTQASYDAVADLVYKKVIELGY